MKKFILASITFNLLIIFTLGFGFTKIAFAADPVTPPATTSTDAKSAACEGVSLTGGSCETDGAGKKINSLVKTIINIFSWIVGVTAVIMVIIGGFKYITSGGDSGKISSAKDTILYAVIGLVIVAMAQIIVKFVLSKL